jgi:tRNA dimethylallyltransferase
MGIAYINSNKKILCIVGPTATGKTDIGLSIAKKFSGEIIACDSRQVYTGLDLGTGKDASDNQLVSKHHGYWLIDGIKIWLYDVAHYQQQYSVSDYIKDATSAIYSTTREFKLPIIVGGTGFYLDGLLYGVDSDQIPADENLRKNLLDMDLKKVQQMLFQLDEDYFNSLNNSEKNNQRRLIRKIEILQYRQKNPELILEKKGLSKEFQLLKIGLTADKKVLDKRIDQRVFKRVEQGMLEETEILHNKGLTYPRMRQLGLEYGVMADYFEGIIKSKNQFVFVLQQKIKQFAKRQLTWFKRDKEIVWIDITEKNYLQKVEKLVQAWYNS